MDYRDFKKIIESCHLNFLIGSGASRPFLSTLSKVEILLTNLSLDEDLEEDERIIIEASIKYHYLKKCIEGNLHFENNTNPKFEATTDNYLNFIQSLHSILAKRRDNLVSKQVNLFTSNMDVFLEWNLESLHYSYNDGFLGRMKPVFGTENFHNTLSKTSTHYEYKSEVPLFNIFKMHGSVNWRQENQQIVYDHGFSVLRSISEIEIEEANLLEIEYEDEDEDEILTKSLDELKEDLENKEIQKNENHDNFLSGYSNLVMINPTKQKFETTTRDLTFYELLRMYSNHLERENSVLFVIGFSFQDEHIREITRRVATSNPTLTIVIFAYDKEAKESIESLLSQKTNLPNVKYIWDNDEDDPLLYSLDKVNEKYFGKLAEELKRDKEESLSQEATSEIEE